MNISKIFSLSVLLLCVSCIPTFSNPVTPVENACSDKNIIGNWMAENPENPNERIRIEVSKLDDTWHRTLSQEVGKVEQGEKQEGRFFLSCLKNQTYINFVEKDKSGAPSYLIMKYKYHGSDQLSLWFPDTDVFASLIKQNKVKGNVEGSFVQSVTVTEESSKLQKILTQERNPSLFKKANLFHRIK